jgi:hypothetical protein
VEEYERQYSTHIWGSTIEDRRSPVDLDLIFEYKTEPIGSDREESIEGWIKNSVYVSEFSYVDPMVVHYRELSSIISRSRVSSVYNVETDSWIEFDK